MLNIFKLIAFLLRSSKGARFYRSALAFSILASVVAGAASASFVPLINNLLNASESERASLYWFFLGLCITLPISRFVAMFLLARLNAYTQADVQMTLCRQMLSTPLRRLEEVGTGRIMACLTQDVGTVVSVVAVMPGILMNLTVILSLMGYLGYLSWQLLLAVLVFISLGVLSYMVPTQLAVRRFRAARQMADKVFENFRALTEGIKELKIHERRRGSFLDRHLEPSVNSRARYRLMGQAIFGAAQSWGQMLLLFFIGLLLLESRRFFGDVTALTLTGYTLALLYILTPIETVLNNLPAISQANVSLRQIKEMGLTLKEKSEAAQAGTDGPERSFQDRWSRLELRAIKHQYYSESDDRHFTLGPVDLTLQPGECVFLVGGNGSGKTTLAKLLIGLYVPESGEIRMDGQEVNERNREAFRQLFAVVFSNPYVFESLLGMEEVEVSLAEQRLKRLQLHHKVKVNKGVLSTVDLSQGQRKRLALFTALLEDRPIYVFDEWAADQDPEFKKFFYLEILPSLKAAGKALLVITHDDRYFDRADRIVKLDCGMIVDGEAQGNPRQGESDREPEGVDAGQGAPSPSLEAALQEKNRGAVEERPQAEVPK